jgi:hypothetical protein
VSVSVSVRVSVCICVCVCHVFISNVSGVDLYFLFFWFENSCVLHACMCMCMQCLLVLVSYNSSLRPHNLVA